MVRSGRLTHERGEGRQASLRVVEFLQERRRRGPSSGLVPPPEVVEDVFDRQPQAEQEEKAARDGVSSEAGHA